MIKFVADEMLGKLAKLLRAMGRDVVYNRPFPDDEILHIAKNENRVLLTRDTRLIKRPEIGEYLFIKDDLPFNQAVQVVKAYGIDTLATAFTRCMECNTVLIRLSKDEVTGKVPPYVFLTQTSYTKCTGCGKIYWPGTHRSRMETTLRSIMDMENETKNTD